MSKGRKNSGSFLCTKRNVHNKHVIFFSSLLLKEITGFQKLKSLYCIHKPFTTQDEYHSWLLRIKFSFSLLNVVETGLRDKLLHVIVSLVYQVFVNKDFAFNLKSNENLMELDEIKIAIGPILLGIVLAIVVFLLEKSSKLINHENVSINGNVSSEHILSQYLFHNYLVDICIFIGLSQKINFQ